MNVIIVDDKNLMAGSFRRYFRYRFGNTVNISSASNPDSFMREIEDASQVIVLDYPSDGHYDTQHATSIVNTIKEHKPNTDIVLLASENDARDDLIETTRQLEEKASKYIAEVIAIPVTPIASVPNRFLLPVRLFVNVFSVGDFIYLNSVVFILMAIVVVVALLGSNMF